MEGKAELDDWLDGLVSVTLSFVATTKCSPWFLS